MGKTNAKTYPGSCGSQSKSILLEAAPIVHELSMNKSGNTKASKQMVRQIKESCIHAISLFKIVDTFAKFFHISGHIRPEDGREILDEVE